MPAAHRASAGRWPPSGSTAQFPDGPRHEKARPGRPPRTTPYSDVDSMEYRSAGRAGNSGVPAEPVTAGGSWGMLGNMSAAEIHREPFIHLVDLASDRALIAWARSTSSAR